jgi:UDPglucose 6-dehydrogenase
MNISVIGGGYVGLVMAAGLAELGHSVVCAEHDPEKLTLLNAGKSPIHENGLTELLGECLRQKTLTFVSSVTEAIYNAQLIFIAVGTPSASDGSADTSAVTSVALEIGKHLASKCVIAIKSTVPVGTCAHVEKLINQELDARKIPFDCNVVSNPEFLKEGDALKDFRRPDRIVIGSNSEHAIEVMRRAYGPFVRNHERLVIVDRESAELGKYASNAMLASRISFMNELSAVSESTGADIEQIRAVMGSDKRIGSDFLYAGPGFGGSCFPKDIRALAVTARTNGISTPLLNAILEVNERQKNLLAKKAVRILGALENKTIAVWGLAFKPNTDDTREAPSLNLINSILSNGGQVHAFDPIVKSLNQQIDSKIKFFDDKYACAQNADLLVLVTEWKTCKNPDFDLLSQQMKSLHILDGRNIWKKSEVETFGFTYEGIGR